jgi:hypothetical protein
MSSIGACFRTHTRRWISPFARSRVITCVTVSDEKFQIIRQLSSEAELAAFRALWLALIEVDRSDRKPSKDRVHLAMDIQHRGRGGRLYGHRWFYHSDGYVTLLAIIRAIWVGPLYRTSDPHAFEALLREGVRG